MQRNMGGEEEMPVEQGIVPGLEIRRPATLRRLALIPRISSHRFKVSFREELSLTSNGNTDLKGYF